MSTFNQDNKIRNMQILITNMYVNKICTVLIYIQHTMCF